MIHQQINKYEETSSYTPAYYGSSATKTQAEKDAWAKEVQDDTEMAKRFFDVGDLVTVKNEYSTQRVIITEFLSDPEKIYPYRNKPCFIMATNSKYPTNGPTRYSLQEFDLNSVEKNYVSK